MADEGTVSENVQNVENLDQNEEKLDQDLEKLDQNEEKLEQDLEKLCQRVVAIAIDGSDHAKFAFNYYVDNVRKPNDNVYLIHTVEIKPDLHSTQWYSTPNRIEKNVLAALLEEEKVKIKQKLEQLASMLKDSGVDGVVKSVNAESPGVGIVKAAKEMNAEIIVIGSRGMGKIRRTFMGSVSDYVIHHSHVPVLVCRHDSLESHTSKESQDSPQQKPPGYAQQGSTNL